MIIKYLTKTINRTTLEVSEQLDFKGEEAVRSYVHTIFESLSDVEQDRAADDFEVLLQKLDKIEWQEALKDIPAGEWISAPFSFRSFTHVYVVTVVIKK